MKSAKYQSGGISVIDLFFTYLLVLLVVVYAAYKYGGLTAMGITVAVFLGVTLMLIAGVFFFTEGMRFFSNKNNVEENEKNEIEASYPGTRATKLSNGNWLVVSKVTGETIIEIDRGKSFNCIEV